jgi:hypothetical protein
MGRRGACIVLLLSALAVGLATSSAAATAPTLRLGSTTGLALVGSGFKPRVLVTVRVVAPDFTRRVVVRAGPRGVFRVTLPALDRCEPTLVVARAANGAVARVPVPRLVRDCMPPPPIQP